MLSIHRKINNDLAVAIGLIDSAIGLTDSHSHSPNKSHVEFDPFSLAQHDSGCPEC